MDDFKDQAGKQEKKVKKKEKPAAVPKAPKEPKEGVENRTKVIAVLAVLAVLFIFIFALSKAGASCNCAERRAQLAGDRSAEVSGSDRRGSGISGSDYAGKASDSDSVGGNGPGTLPQTAGNSAVSPIEGNEDLTAGSEQYSGGCLSFLFGCGGRGCYEGFLSQSCVSLTDLVDEDQNEVADAVNINDGKGVHWAAQADDIAYTGFMKQRADDLTDSLMRLDELGQTLAQLADSGKIQRNEKFAEISRSVLTWCQCAESYDRGQLVSEKAVSVYELSLEVARAARVYIESYPGIAAGTQQEGDAPDASGSNASEGTAPDGGKLSADMLYNDLSDALIALYSALDSEG